MTKDPSFSVIRLSGNPVIPLFPLRLKKGHDADIRQGFPWIYAGDMIESSELLHAPAGSLVSIENHKGEKIGTGYFNAKSQIACRVLTLEREPINQNFFTKRFEKALLRRQHLFPSPLEGEGRVGGDINSDPASITPHPNLPPQGGKGYYRLVHSESDQLPGLLIDRFGDALVAQVGTAGMEQLQPLWLPALEALLQPKTIILRGDTTGRAREGLAQDVRILKGEAPEFTELQENNCLYFADLVRGQKTGWFYDQRDNRQMIAELAKNKTLLDVYCHSGGFGVLAAKHGAREVTMVDSSKLALELAKKSAEKNNVTCKYMQGDAFEVMQKLAGENKRYDIVLADPPAFVKSRKDIASGMKGYEKVSRLAAALVEEGGLLFIASCSHHASRGAFLNAVMAGIAKAGRDSELIKQTGAAPDHPRHPLLPQSEYLKGLLLKIAS